MRGIFGAVEIRQMARDASGAAQRVVVIYMARGALLGGVQSHQREPGGRVIECRAEPVDCRMAP